MSDCPRTDKALMPKYTDGSGNRLELVYADFARTLERELNAEVEKAIRQNDKLIAERDEARADCTKWVAELDNANRDFCNKAIDVNQLRADLDHQKHQTQEMAREAVLLRAEVERLRLASFSQFSRIEELKIACDQWRAVAEQLAQELTDNLAPGLPSPALDEYEKQKQTKP